MSTTTCELKWLKGLLNSLGVAHIEPMNLYCDSQAALHIVANPVYHERTKHIELDCHFIHDEILNGNIRTDYRMVKAANKHRREVHFNVGDSVFLKLRPHRQSTLKQAIHSKLAARYFGPFTISKKVGSVAYKLQLPEHVRIHPIFHVSQLKRVISQHQVAPALSKELEVDEELIEPEDVLQHRISTINGNSISQLLIKWKGKPIEEATWMAYFDVVDQFPSFSLEDKAVL
ncbi:hypothetical protein GH714_011560 [Hevea brasiliensis]|uniref:Chromo domain-containing protein n=1 Tax=Hevea brasiliensis TaxID=3981 RepID=A0A6A6L0T1_HEVBR|nr:hypothetical protein GH714_011560 [Hevea brasiliensis]